jgi:subtilase family protein/peptidase inhibitor I9
MLRIPRRWSIGLTLAAVLVTTVGPGPATAAARAPAIRGAGVGSVVEGSYLVHLKDTPEVREAGVRARAEQLTREYGGTLGTTFVHVMKGFSVTMPEELALRLSTDPDVDHVDQDRELALDSDAKKAAAAGGTMGTASGQTPVTWGLDRIDQHTRPLDEYYGYDESAGEGVRVYILSTGVEASHPDLAGRVVSGPNFVTDGGSSSTDCNGLGTQMAGIVGGTRFGVAKKAQLVSVRNSRCTSNTRLEWYTQSMEWVVNNVQPPALVVSPLSAYCLDPDTGGDVECPPGIADAVVDAQEAVFDAGIPVIGMAGNSSEDSCVRGTGLAPDTIYVGAVDVTDAQWSNSGFGSCVTMYAPGRNVTTANRDGGSGEFSGTHLAAAYVAGAAALFMGKPEFAGASPTRIREELVTNRSTKDVLTGLGENSPNLLLYTGPSPTVFTVGSAVALAPVGNGDKLRLIGATADGKLEHRQQTGPGSTSWTGWTESVTRDWASMGVGTNADGRMALAAVTRSGGQVWVRQEASPGTNSWSRWVGLGAAPGNVPIARVSIAHNNSNRLQVFVVTTGGLVYHRSQVGVGSQAFNGWTALPATPKLRSLTAATNADGRIEVLGVDDAGAVWRTAQDSATDNRWGLFTKLGGHGVVAISAARNENGLLELIGLDAGGSASRRSQTAPGAAEWNDWTSVNSTALAHIAARTTTTGIVQLVGVDNLGRIWQSKQNARNSTVYVPWTSVDGRLRV